MITKWDQQAVTDLTGNNSDLTYEDIQRITGLSAATLNVYLSQSIMGCYVLAQPPTGEDY